MQRFTTYLQKKDLAKNTQTRYAKDVNYFLGWLSTSIDSCTKVQILDYLEYLQQVRSNTNHSRNLALNSLKHYFNYLLQNQQITTNPTNNIKLRGTKKKQLHQLFTTEQLEQLYDNYYHYFISNYSSNSNFEAVQQRAILSKQRNFVMLGFLIYQGINTTELLALELQHINLQKATVQIPRRKRNKERTIPLNASQIGYLLHYINVVRENFKPQNDLLFLPQIEFTNSKRQKENCKNALQNLSEEIQQIGKAFTNFNQIRASVITSWLQQFGLRKTQYLAGHKFISSTENYVANDIETLKNDITTYNPF